jgi:hypothetical protein
VALPSGPPLAARIPQDLSEFADTITQEMLDNPNSLLQTEPNESWRITENIEISVSTQPAEPLFGGGIDNIAFLLAWAHLRRGISLAARKSLEERRRTRWDQ